MSQELTDAMAHRDRVIAELRAKLDDLNTNLLAASRIEPIPEPCCGVLEMQACVNNLAEKVEQDVADTKDRISAMLAKNEQRINDINEQFESSIRNRANFGGVFGVDYSLFAKNKRGNTAKEQRLIDLCNTPCWKYKA